VKKLLVWSVVAANVAVVAASFAAPVLVVPFAVSATLLAVGLAYTARAGASESRAGERKEDPSPRVVLQGNYELGERIASGSMGDVFRARHQALGRDVAFKRIKPGSIDDADKRRFEREARVLSLLKSPHTVEVYDFGVTPEGELFYVMELLDGIDLQTTVREHGPMPPERVVYLLLQACASLIEAHDRSLVHRDIKPANLMICRYGGEFDFLKILDFGLVKKPAGRESMAGVTNPATVLGTPAYLAPESASGSKFVDQRADLYALAAVGFWLLTGRLLFETDKPLVMVKMHLTEPPPKASSHSRFEVPEALDSLLLDCLQKKPDQRPESADAVRRRLEAIPLAARWDRDRAASWWKERVLAPKVTAR
jgi:serine/threonine-protein kinase